MLSGPESIMALHLKNCECEIKLPKRLTCNYYFYTFASFNDKLHLNDLVTAQSMLISTRDFEYLFDNEFFRVIEG